MKIAIDLRSLQTGSVSGVENYILNLLEHLLELDRQNEYIFFYNSYGTTGLKHLQYVNSRTVETRIPNRFLNLSLKFLQFPKFEKLLGDFDVLFLPNANYFALTPQKKLVVTVHDLSPFILPEFYNLRWRLGHWMQNIAKTYKRADLLLAVSEHTKQDLIKVIGIPESKIKVIIKQLGEILFDEMNLSIIQDSNGVQKIKPPKKYLTIFLPKSWKAPRGRNIGI